MDYLSKKIKILAVLSLSVLFGIAGCDSEVTSPDSTANNGLSTVESQNEASQAQFAKADAAAKKLLDFAEEKGYDLDAADQKLAELTSETYDAQYFDTFTANVVDSSKFQCGPTPLNAWANENLIFANMSDLFFIVLNGIDQYPFLYSLIFEEPRNPRQTYGYNGEYTRQVTRVNRSIRRFWDVNLSPVQTLSAHGSMLADYDKVFALVEVLYPTFSEESNAQFSQLIVDVVTASPIYNNGDAPLFSFNALSYREGPIFVGGEVEPPKIIIGDGILDGMDAIGLGAAAPEAILSHEFSHQVQFQLNVYAEDTLSDPVKSTRRTELMADALASYYLGHKRGAAFNWDRVEKFMRGYFNVGDCNFESPGHHGTPNQRIKAAQFGFDLAESADRRVRIMSAEDVITAFDAELSVILEPDTVSAPAAIAN